MEGEPEFSPEIEDESSYNSEALDDDYLKEERQEESEEKLRENEELMHELEAVTKESENMDKEIIEKELKDQESKKGKPQVYTDHVHYFV